MRVDPAGDRGFLIDFGSVGAEKLHGAAARVRRLPNVVAAIVGQQSIYVICASECDPTPIMETARDAEPLRAEERRRHEISVSFAGEYALDLPELLERERLSFEAFLSRTAALRLTARYLGFRAGFAYLDGWPAQWAMPRRVTARPEVPRGSFAIANAVAGFYPIASPGGWNILGRTDMLLWDPRRDPPNLIAAGDEVRLVPHVRPIDVPVVPDSPEPPHSQSIEVIANAQFTTWVSPADWRRLDHGMPAGGPFDPAAAEAANRAAGNPADAGVLECALVGPRLRARERCLVTWSGAASDLTDGEVIALDAGEELPVGRIRDGMRGYLAFARWRADVSPTVRHRVRRRIVGAPREWHIIHVVPGPHDKSLGAIECEVTPQLNRIGVRLRPLQKVNVDIPATLPSCGMQFGTIQLHPDGSLVAMGPDHPVTGGYLQVMTVRWNERWKLGQLAPGDRVVFTE